MMQFDSNRSEVFETEGTVFEYNHERTEYIADDILNQYEAQMRKMVDEFNSSNRAKKLSLADDIFSLHSEWNVTNNNETLYLVFNHEDECFTDVRTDNEHYTNPFKKS
jgi:hypothetical protein